ncbi:MAG: hypothetical protein Kow0092_21410 [Deferrisomatales bacterium]
MSKSDYLSSIPERVEVLELLLRDGLQHFQRPISTETKLFFADQFARAGYRKMEVTNFAHPRYLPQASDAEEILRKVRGLESVQKNRVHLKCYGMTKKAFERAADCAQKGFGPDSVAFTISTEDLHCRRNAGRTREEYLKEIPDLVKIAEANGFAIDMAIACVYGSPCAGPVPIENTFELIDRGLDMGIRHFTPCDTTGESNPRRTYEYMAALVDRYGKYDGEMKFRVAHFHEGRGLAIANTLAAVQAGARIVEASLGLGGGQPAFIVDGVPGIGTGPNYTNAYEVGNCASEDILVALDEMGVETGIEVEKILQLGRLLEWVMEKTLPVWTTKAGRPIKYPVEWNISRTDLSYVPPYGPPQIIWADPGKYKPATRSQIEEEFAGREVRLDPFEEALDRAEVAWPTRLIGDGDGRARVAPEGRAPLAARPAAAASHPPRSPARRTAKVRPEQTVVPPSVGKGR